ncbi:hypothetical protein KIN20_016090 [Parelaphostrongylus tenuis]|uniref:Mini-chromosome maintenance complex-binding protein n=1 Tax=Parelaphostrongylus tenuis TaxID=148309 RepID=A0AAD5QMQ5_PARTN|nr:hypothetical protein KIN20_016090 [Parelaphostrongylus tenuis]
MAPAPETASRDFLEIIDELWEKNSKTYIKSPNKFLSDLNEIFADKKLFVSLHSSKVLPGYLVCARCMVQNVLSPEYIPISYTITSGSTATTRETTGFFRDCFGDYVTDNHNLSERHCYKMVMVPGAVEWWLDDFNRAHTTVLCNTDTDEDAVKGCSSPLPVKISSFIAKVFANGSPELKPNTVVDVYGYLSSAMPAEVGDNSYKHFDVHVLRISNVNDVAPELESSSYYRLCIRFNLVKDVSSVLGSIASADIFVNFLVSNTYSRAGDTLPLCSMPLNIVGVEDSHAVNSIIGMIEQLMPKVKILTVTPELLSQRRYAPFKDYETDDLLQGDLQLSNGTVLVIDETQFSSGYFPVSGFVEENLKFLQIPMDVDYNIVILSRKESKLFQTPFRIPLQPCRTSLSISDLQLQRNFLQQSREAVKTVTLTEDISKKIQDNFVALCSTLDGKTDKAAFLHKMLIMSRLTAASSGSSCLELMHYEYAQRIFAANSSALDAWRSR